ncbi:MAG: GNAT family N-acetyltransferase [Sphingobacteriales bacterium]|nr:MAG: GNAT family N-acetyltransferase [Sphingobacteriales bacterium]
MIQITKITTPEELEKAFEIRKQVFVIEQDVDPEEEYDEFENTSTHYLAYYNNEAVGTARWRYTSPQTIKLERFAILKDYRDKKVGREILRHILGIVKMLQPKKIYLHAQIQVVDFYKKAGFIAVGEQFSEANILHYKMIYSPLKNESERME